jgi:hypothetical protein
MANICTDKFEGEMAVKQSWWSDDCKARKISLNCVSIIKKHFQSSSNPPSYSHWGD